VLAANSSQLFCTLRSRKRCELLDDSGALIRELHVLNECVIDRCVGVWAGCVGCVCVVWCGVVWCGVVWCGVVVNAAL
jgi:hypothetical protein